MKQGMDNFHKTISYVLSECFWGDYRFNADEIERKIVEGKETFIIFLTARIIADSFFPSARLKALFPIDKLKVILNKITATGRISRRMALVRAVLFGEKADGLHQWPAA